MIKKWKESIDQLGAFSALATNLSKDSDCFYHELLIAKLDGYDFEINEIVSAIPLI